MSSRREVSLAILFAGAAILFTLGIGEAAIRLISSRRLIYNIGMVKYAKELKTPDPTGAVSHIHRPSSSARLMGVDVSLNSLGNRGPEMENPKSASTKRVLVLGSSITMGWGVPQEKVFTSLAQTRLNQEKPLGPYSFEIANAGIGNYNTHFQYELFKKQYPVLKPDLVVLHYFISDVQPRTMGRNNFLLKHSFLAAFLFDRWSQIAGRMTGNFKDLFTFYNDLYRDDSQAWQTTQKEIREMRDIMARDKVPFLIMIIPDIHDLSPGSPFGPLYQKMEKAFNGMNIPTLNTFDSFEKKFGSDVSQLWIQSDDPHPNARGHELMANAFYDLIVSQSQLRPPPPQ